MKACSLTLLALILTPLSASAATVLLSDGFETTLGNWTGSTDAVRYDDSVSNPDYATTGIGSVKLRTNGDGLALTLTDALELTSIGATSVTISFDYVWNLTGSTTRFFHVEYSANNGANWTQFSGGQLNANTTGFASFTRSTGLTDDFLFRFRAKNDSGTDVAAFIDNVVISAEGNIIPEPTAALLGACGFLALLRRRR